MDFSNVYADAERAASYAKLEFPGTYYLAFRDLPAIVRAHACGRRAMDFGCGAGRSTRFLRALGFDAVGIDISEPMIAQARSIDPRGDYRLIRPGDFSAFPKGSYDLILSAFTFDNIPTLEEKTALFSALRDLLETDGKIINLVSSPEIYVNEWASFSTRDFPKNREARCGDQVLIVMLDVDDKRPVEDVLWTDAGYRDVYKRASLRQVEVYKPLGKRNDGHAWVSETEVAPWTIHVLARAE